MSSRRSGALPRVGDFSTGFGTGTRRHNTVYRYMLYAPYGAWTNSPNNSVVGLRFKSPTVRGLVDPSTGVKLATNYSRIVFSCQNYSEAFKWRTYEGADRFGPIYTDHEMTGPIHGTGFTMVSSKFNATTGVVSVDPNYVNRAKAEAYEDLLDCKISIGQALAEVGQTLGYLAQLVRRFVACLVAIRRLRSGRYTPSQVWRSLRSNGVKYRKSRKRPSVGDAWLEYQYALMPLIYDIYGTSELLREGLRRRDAVFSVQRTIGGSVSPASFVFSTYPNKVTGDVKESARVVYTGKVNPGILAAAAELGLVNPLLIAWELVPFSFVVDWILPIGSVLSSISAPLGVTFVDGYLDSVVYGNVEASRDNPTTLRSGSLPVAKLKLLAFQRSTYTVWPGVLPYIKSPFSSSHAVTALALMAQLKK